MHKKRRGGELITIKNQLSEENTNQKQSIVNLYKRAVSKLERPSILIRLLQFIEKQIIKTSYDYNIKQDIVTYGGKLKIGVLM